MATSDAPGGEPGLRQVRAARIRARLRRQGIIQTLLGSVFLAGAIAHARSPDRHAQSTIAWMAGLLLLSTVDVAVGLRTLARLRGRQRGARLWIAGTAAWGLLSLAVLAFLLRS